MDLGLISITSVNILSLCGMISLIKDIRALNIKSKWIKKSEFLTPKNLMVLIEKSLKSSKLKNVLDQTKNLS